MFFLPGQEARVPLKSLCAGDNMIEPDLENIVVEISRDGKTSWGTGFFMNKNEVVTCYHVLESRESHLVNDYYIRHGTWTNWEKATPIMDRCDSKGDFAVMHCEAKNLTLPDISLEKWDGISREFRSYGYGTDLQKMRSEIRSYSIEGTINGITQVNNQRKLLLETTIGTIQYGRSGSPVFSLAQKAIVGILYLAGGEKNINSELALAIPIEDVVTVARSSSNGGKRELREAIVRSFSIEELDLLCDDVQHCLAQKGINLEVNLEMVGGISKAAKVLNLIEYLDRRDCLNCLIEVVHKVRPKLRW
jgi:hypothetical protein